MTGSVYVLTRRIARESFDVLGVFADREHASTAAENSASAYDGTPTVHTEKFTLSRIVYECVPHPPVVRILESGDAFWFVTECAVQEPADGEKQ